MQTSTAKAFKTWDQLIALMYAPDLLRATSLREVEAGFNSQKLHHFTTFGNPQTIRRFKRWPYCQHKASSLACLKAVYAGS